MGGGAPSIPQRDLGGELGSILGYLPKFGKASFGLADKFAPQFSGLDVSQLAQFAPQYAGLGYGIAGQYAPQYAQLGLDLSRQFGPQYSQLGQTYARNAFDITKQYGPEYQQLNQAELQRAIAQNPLLRQLNTTAQAQLKTGGADPLLQQLTGQAQSQLALGGQLSPQEANQITQATRAGFAARGNVLGNQALGTELLNRDIYSQQRQQQREQFAGSVEGQRQSALGQAEQFGQGVQGLDLGTLGSLGAIGMPNLGAYAGQPQAPNLAAYAQPPNFPGYAQPGGGFTPYQAGLGASGQVINPLLNYGSDLYSSNQSAAGQSAIAGANKSSGAIGGGASALGAIAGGVGLAL